MITRNPKILRYKALTRLNLPKSPVWGRLSSDVQESVSVGSAVWPFRTNRYVTDYLIDWKRVPDDPIFQLTFPQRGMLHEEDFASVSELFKVNADKEELQSQINRIRLRTNPHPAGQLSHNVPILDGRRLEGIQHKYRETVLFFPSQGQTCHAYCTYCFRWPQFVGLDDFKFQSPNPDDLIAYLQTKPDVTDLLVTGGDPLVMKAKILEGHIAPILEAGIEHLRTIRIGSKALAYWPFRFTTDPDADDLLRLFDRIVSSGRHLALMAHFSHPRELSTPEVREAIQRIRATGTQIRMQAPLIRHVNDSAEAWAELWEEGVSLGLVPYYMFVERNTGPKEYFKVSLHRAHRIFKEAFNQVSGLARTVRGPSMSAFPGKVHLLGSTQIGRDKVFVLEFIQARNPDWVGRPFFAEFDPEASWLSDLKPAFGKANFFFEREAEPWAVSGVA